MNIAIIGSRDYNNWPEFRDIMNVKKGTFGDLSLVKIISGGARGPDSYAIRWAKENNLKWQEFLPDWKQYGKKAGYLRNATIIENADRVIAFWDGSSKGTSHSMVLARAKGIPLEIVLVTPIVYMSERKLL